MSQVNERRLKFVLVLAIAAAPLSLQIYLPAMPQAQAEFGATAAGIQLTFSLAIFSSALIPLVYGPVSDRYGRRRVLFIGFLVFALGSVLCALATSALELTIARIIQTVGASAGMVIVRAVVGDVYAREQAAKVMASLIVAMIVAPMIAPTLGGLIAQFMGWRAIFWIISVVALIMSILVWAYLPETLKEPVKFPGIGGMLGAFGKLLKEPLFIAFVGQGAFMMCSFYIFLACAPYVVVNVMGRPEGEFGLYFLLTTAGFTLGNILAGRYSDRLGIERMIVIGSILSFFATWTALGLSLSHLWIPVAVFGPIMVMGCANGLCLPNSSAGAVAVNPQLAGSAAGLMTFLQMGAAAVASQITGSIQNGTPYPMSIGMATASVLSLVTFITFLHISRRKAQQTAV